MTPRPPFLALVRALVAVPLAANRRFFAPWVERASCRSWRLDRE
jgi:hypothetical protein